MVERGIIFPVLSVQGKWGRLFPSGNQEEGNNAQDLHLLKGSVHCSLVSRPKPTAHESLWFILPPGLPLCIQQGTENSVCLFIHKKVFTWYCSIWVPGSGSQDGAGVQTDLLNQYFPLFCQTAGWPWAVYSNFTSHHLSFCKIFLLNFEWSIAANRCKGRVCCLHVTQIKPVSKTWKQQDRENETKKRRRNVKLFLCLSFSLPAALSKHRQLQSNPTIQFTPYQPCWEVQVTPQGIINDR